MVHPRGHAGARVLGARLLVAGRLAFFGSYNAGLQVVDYGDPRNLRRAAYYIAPGTTAWGALFHDGYIYVGDMARGLDVYTLDDPELLLKLKVKVRIKP